MFVASFYFLGLAAFILATSVCLSWGKRAGRCVEVELDALCAASVCLPAGRRATPDATATTIYKEMSWDEKAKWTDMKAMWMRWYHRCQEKAIAKQKAMYSLARTMALCAALCLFGVLLEAKFDQPITVATVLAGFRDPSLGTPSFLSFHLAPPQSMSAPTTAQTPRK